MTLRTEQQLTKLGFKFGKNGAHSARSMMIVELKYLLDTFDEDTTSDMYKRAVVDLNVLHKPTEKSRSLTSRHLIDLYGLDPQLTLFKVLRQWWERDEASQPILALQLAIARDPLLRASCKVVVPMQVGEPLSREEVESFLAKDDPDRFSAASLKSFAQNLNGTWTQAGYLSGRNKKFRAEPKISYVHVAFALFLAHCHGISGQRLFDSQWCQFLDQSKDRLYELAYIASLRGLLNFKQASDVVEVTFPAITLPKETQ